MHDPTLYLMTRRALVSGAAALLLSGCSTSDAVPPLGTVHQAASDASTDGTTAEDASAGTQDSGETKDVSIDGTAPGDAQTADARDSGGSTRDASLPGTLLPPKTPNARYDFLSSPAPELQLTPVVTFTPDQLPDRSVSPPEVHDVLTPSDIEFFPDDSGQLFVILSTGLVAWLDRDMEILGTFFVDSSNSLVKYRARNDALHDNEGVLGLAFDPRFYENGYFYVHTVREAMGGVDVYRLRFKPDQIERTWESRKLIFSAEKPDTASDPIFLRNHDGGNLSFGPDGMLYIAIGDGGIGGGLSFDFNPAQDLSSPWGKVLRIDPHGEAPAEVVAMGLRNPFTHGWRGDELFIGDVGSDQEYSWEEINRLVVSPQSSVDPVNFGWPTLPGPCAAERTGWFSVEDCSPFTDPVHGYRKDDDTFYEEDPDTTREKDGIRSALILGPAYGGGAYEGYLDNVILYGDLIQGWVRGVLFNAQGAAIADRHLVHHGKWITGFATGPDDHIYMLGGFGDDFSIFRIELNP